MLVFLHSVSQLKHVINTLQGLKYKDKSRGRNLINKLDNSRLKTMFMIITISCVGKKLAFRQFRVLALYFCSWMDIESCPQRNLFFSSTHGFIRDVQVLSSLIRFRLLLPNKHVRQEI